ncbi:Kdo domain containing protein [Flavobacterium sp. '19STA2R22 D10 B1']|uniref:Kdo domain containing protein n=1 Tax=Flavobacterium aerium TaxID=3037261 RepID=UPI00278BD797|nr:Kdo domain containing protein [Flavobacterium sp. '19STA2R22 D10 B1']
MKINIHPNHIQNKSSIISIIEDFNENGKIFGNGDRNTIKLFEYNDRIVNVKSFKIPNLINKVAYKYFRKSKAKRSYEFANYLLANEIGTPDPIAYFEKFNFLGLNKSFYVSNHLETELTFRELVLFPEYPDNENILRQFIQFSFLLHEKGIEFLDHSPGNTLIKKTEEGKYDFFLVDLNRMRFHSELSFEQRMKNLSKLTSKKDMVIVMSDEYAKLCGKEKEEVFEKMWYYTNNFQAKFQFKKKIKKKFKFW